jgi:glyoxylase I family protein
MIAAGATPPLRIAGIDHVLLLVRDLDEALAFYQGVIGARLETSLPHLGMVELRTGTSSIGLVDVSSDAGAWARSGTGRNLDHLALRCEVPDVAALRRHLSERGTEIVEERREASESLSLYVRDPSGNVIELLFAALD